MPFLSCCLVVVVALLALVVPAELLALPLTEVATATRPDLVVDATWRLLPAAPGAFLALSATAGLAALGLTAHNAMVLRTQSVQQARDLEALQARERRLRLTVHEAEDGLLHLEPVRDARGDIIDFEIVEANARAGALLRREPLMLVGRRVRDTVGLSSDDELFRGLAAAVELGTVYRGERRVHPRYVATSWLLVRAVRVDQGLAVTLSDIAERKREARRLRRASLVDPLTSLVNRRGFLDIANEQLASARRLQQEAVLFYLDCDDFKGINDGFGHAVGDRALTEIARALRAALRETDVIARLGGDEFAVLALDTVGSCADTIRSRVNARLDALNRAHVLPASVSVTIGHVVIPATETRALADLLHEADCDLLHRKATRRIARKAMAAIMASPVAPRPRQSTRDRRRNASAAQTTSGNRPTNNAPIAA
ncbi:MAG: GGDEF domain-containing protein [Gemmatimonadaceae bacterium]|jgi:diguanylate cyclase (GGDEF)-like protein|nr:GGDEF domain-containing protein [Gemmatimonadaceae bacterium]